jgi:hypothetical protein
LRDERVRMQRTGQVATQADGFPIVFVAKSRPRLLLGARIVFDADDQLGVDVYRAEVVDQHRHAQAVVAVQDPVEQRRLSRAEKPGLGVRLAARPRTRVVAELSACEIWPMRA